MRLLLSLLLLCFVAPAVFGESLDANGIRMTYPDGYAKPVLSTTIPHSYTYSSFKKTASFSVIAVAVRITDGKLTNESKQQMMSSDRISLLEGILDSQLNAFSDSVPLPGSTVSVSPLEMISISNQRLMKKTLVQSSGKITRTGIFYSALVNFKLVQFQIMASGEISKKELDDISAAVEQATLDSDAIGSISIN